MGDLVQPNDRVLLDVSHTNERAPLPIVIASVCANAEPHAVVLPSKLPDDLRLELDSGGVTNLFEYYAALNPPLSPDTVVIRPPTGTITFSNLQHVVQPRNTFWARVADSLRNFASERCPRRVGALSFTIDGEHQGNINVHRLYCRMKIDLYVAVNLRELMRDANDYENFIRGAMVEMKLSGKNYVTQEAFVLRDGAYSREFPIVRRVAAGRLIVYLHVGIGDFLFQSGWEVDDQRRPCIEIEDKPSSGKKTSKKKSSRKGSSSTKTTVSAKLVAADPFAPKYQKTLRESGEDKPEFEEPAPGDDTRLA